MSRARIFKYELEPSRYQMLMMPAEAIPLHVIEQQGKLVMYAQISLDDHNLVPRIFAVITTGEEHEAEGKTYVGTAVLDGWFVAHVFEQTQGISDVVDSRYDDDRQSIKKELA